MTNKIKDCMASSSKVDLFGSSGASTSRVETEPRALNSNDPTRDMIVELIEGMEKMTTTMQSLGSQMIKMKRAQQNQMDPSTDFQLQSNFEFDRNIRTEDAKLSVPLEPTNMVEDKEPWCRQCNGSHPESMCKVYKSLVMIVENTSNEGNLDTKYVNYMGLYI